MNRNLRNQYFCPSILAGICVLVLVLLGWTDNPAFREFSLPGAENSFYNLLIQGFNAGQLNVITPTPVGLTQLANPYDPTLNGQFLRVIFDMSYYHGKLYLYFGVAPALVLYWPYFLVTGHYLSDQAAVFIFLSTGFLALAFLLHSIWQRYFPRVGFWVLALGIFTVGLAINTIQAEWWWSEAYEVAQSSGFAFILLSLVALWQAMHQVKRKTVWLLLASLMYGLAIVSRPNLLFGAMILLVPLIYEWRNSGSPAALRQMVPLFLATACPLAIIGTGLMIYNFLRFGNPLEFGWTYQLGPYPFRQHGFSQFNLRFLGYNFSYYFLEPMRWSAHFPFLQTFDPPVQPPGQESATKNSGGILLVNYPLALAAVAAALAWKPKADLAAAPLRWFVLMATILLVSSGLVLCLLYIACSRYELDLLPGLLILSVVGIFCLEQEITGARRRLARWAWGLLLSYTVVLNSLATVEGQVLANYFSGNFLMRQNRVKEAVKYEVRAVRLAPGIALFHEALGTTYESGGRVDQAIVQFEKALAIDPADAGSQYFLGSCLFQEGESAEAIKHFDLALKLDPHCFDNYGTYGEHAAIAWSLATNPDPRTRDAALAIKFAERACQETDYQMTIVVGTLAAAYAEAGRYAAAVATARQAMVLAQKDGDPKILQGCRDFLALYLKHQPFHQGGLAPEPGASQLNTKP